MVGGGDGMSDWRGTMSLELPVASGDTLTAARCPMCDAWVWPGVIIDGADGQETYWYDHTCWGPPVAVAIGTSSTGIGGDE